MGKRLLWIGACLSCFTFGFIVAKYRVFPYAVIRSIHDRMGGSNVEKKPLSADQPSPVIRGRWARLRPLRQQAKTNRNAVKEKISTLPYLGGYQPAGWNRRGVTRSIPNETFDGVTVYCSGHDDAVYAIAMDGRILHQWKIRFTDVWDQPLPFPVYEEHKQFIRRAHVYPSGDILCVFEYIGLVKLDRESNIIWKRASRNHHDIHVDADGTIYSLERSEVPLELMKRIPNADKRCQSDDIVILSSDGTERDRIPILNAFVHSPYEAVLLNLKGADIFHANSIDVIAKNDARHGTLFQTGDILVSLRSNNTIALIDPVTHKAKWALTGQWIGQHQAGYLRNGNILLFDNRGGNRKSLFEMNRSRVLEFDPCTLQPVWEYPGPGQADVLFSHWLGYNQRLPNGNTLITESTQGRILEVTRQGKIVWEYYNPRRTGKNKRLIATVMGAQRLAYGQLPFLKRKSDP